MGKKDNGAIKAPLLGKLAIKNSLITEAEFDEAINACADAVDPEEAFKNYFITNDLITPQNLKRLVTATKAVELRQKDLKFGSIAVNKGMISQSVLDLVLEEQNQSFKTRKNPRLIGDMLVEAGILTIAHRNLILKTQNRLIKEIRRDYAGNGTDDVSTQDVKQDSTPAKKPLNESTIETIQYGIRLEIAQDSLSALISKTEEFDDNISPDDIRELLIKKGVIFGLVNNDLFLGFIKSSGFKQKSFLAAKGINPVDGINAKIEYFFDIDHLKAGGVSTTGQIDFKDRGIIPQVEKGTVLAEKIPLKEAIMGKTIFGEELPAKKAVEMKLRYGKGTKISEDRLKLISNVNGYPKLTWAGLVIVHQEFKVTGDVNYQTGHIKYDGNITINGCIKDGFEVKGNDIQAREIQGGIINSEGNLTITNGINEATIYAKGNVYAKFVHNSKIACMGDVYIAKEIVDSKIGSGARCITKDGKIISCKITAKMGVFAKQIGTELSEPNTIETGHDIFVKKELSSVKIKIQDLMKEKNKKGKAKEKLVKRNKQYHKDATHLANMQEQTQASDDKINKKLKVCFDEIDKLEQKIETAETSVLETQEKIDDLVNEKNHLAAFSDANPGNAIIEVTGHIFPGTLVKRKHSEKHIKDKLKNSKIKELMYKDDSKSKKRQRYEMVIT